MTSLKKDPLRSQIDEINRLPFVQSFTRIGDTQYELVFTDLKWQVMGYKYACPSLTFEIDTSKYPELHDKSFMKFVEGGRNIGHSQIRCPGVYNYGGSIRVCWLEIWAVKMRQFACNEELLGIVLAFKHFITTNVSAGHYHFATGEKSDKTDLFKSKPRKGGTFW